jgi:ribosome-binding protein aMBF1 (putative translation factor)
MEIQRICKICGRRTQGREWEQLEYTVCLTCCVKHNFNMEKIHDLLGKPKRTLVSLLQEAHTFERDNRHHL